MAKKGKRTLDGLHALTDRIGALQPLLSARRNLALDLLREGISEEEVVLAAGVSWRVLASWCAGDDDPPLPAWHRIELRAEEVRARRLSEKRKRESKNDVAYCHKVERLTALKEEYSLLEKRACVPHTNESSSEIDELQTLLDGWFTVPPERWSEEDFIAAHSHQDPTPQAAASKPIEFSNLAGVEIDFDPNDLF